ncbi:MAG: amino acid permease [Verrucomicrobia bacterium]|nr:amino acid permease [Verrucomicrobiota bacterium]MBU6445918.1 amino acid permease [Verrucomicrobiota bacterium]MDE3047561.1 amino acid permease [Verrucomicrobiota bacterium]
MEIQSNKPLGVFQLVMINVIAVDSIRTLTFSAVYGSSLIFFYLLMALCFFIPTALVSAELGTGWPTRGGIYIWVREAFGKKASLVIIWLNWIYNVIWYPTIMALITGTLTYLFNPDLAGNALYMCTSVLILYWAATLVNCFGMKTSSLLSVIGALVGTIFPMLFITLLGIIWIAKGNPMQITFSWRDLLPHNTDTGNLAFLTNVLFGLLGLEMAATHAAEMRNPKRDYPRSLWSAVIIILCTIVFASLAIAIVVPNQQLSLATGVMQAFKAFLDAYQISWLLPVVALCIVLGAFSQVGAWIIGPTKGLLVAAQDGSFPKFLTKTNACDVPVRILILQALIVSVLSLAFLLFPTINNAYWILSVVTAQLSLFVYIALFAAAIRLHYRKPHVERSFRIPGKKGGIWTVCTLGALTSVLVILIGFIPPTQIPFHNVLLYECILLISMAICCAIPLAFLKTKRSSLQK